MNEVGIVGGGPIGLYSALVLANQGYHVHLFEKRNFPIDKVCGQGIMPKGYELLRKIGIHFDIENSQTFHRIKYVDGDIQVSGELEESGIAIERSTLSGILYDLCSKQELIQIHQNHVIDVTANNKSTSIKLDDESTHTFRYLLACDGLHSFIRRQLGLEKQYPHRKRMGARFHFKESFSKNSVEVHWKQHCEAYITPVGEQRSQLAFLWEEPIVMPKSNGFEFFKEQFPELSRAFENSEGDFRVYGPFNKVSKQLRHKNIFFIGDAYHFIDGITGEGISLGLRSADYICRNLNHFAIWDEWHVKLWYFKYKMIVGIALMLSRYPNLRKTLFQFFKPRQRWFNRILSFNDL